MVSMERKITVETRHSSGASPRPKEKKTPENSRPGKEEVREVIIQAGLPADARDRTM